ncbi:LOW QUALITY PROTEIN: hypothetical protein QYF61_025708 [Mycteria americana]|uniref:Uncharacterized protein n=1 Tax=Mycteria americana TaxID=33587 RepID=A0AAN7PCR6_MYCAM|nr:LOW QUALITY PROTEIN: hypothetical protein QYF61_025708 [Mycteria americana]
MRSSLSLLFSKLDKPKVVVGSDKVSPQPPFLHTKQPQLPQPLLIRLTLHQLHRPSLEVLRHLNVSLVVRGPKLNTVFEGHDHCPSPAGHAISDTSQDAIGLLGHLGTLLPHIQLAVNQHPQVLFHRAALQPLFPKPVALQGVAVAQVQDHALSLVESHTLGLGPSIQPVQIPPYSLPALKLLPNLDCLPRDSVNQSPKQAKVCPPDVQDSSSADPPPYFSKNFFILQALHHRCTSVSEFPWALHTVLHQGLRHLKNQSALPQYAANLPETSPEDGRNFFHLAVAALCTDDRKPGFTLPGTATLSAQDSNTKQGENALFLARGDQFCIYRCQLMARTAAARRNVPSTIHTLLPGRGRDSPRRTEGPRAHRRDGTDPGCCEDAEIGQERAHTYVGEKKILQVSHHSLEKTKTNFPPQVISNQHMSWQTHFHRSLWRRATCDTSHQQRAGRTCLLCLRCLGLGPCAGAPSLFSAAENLSNIAAAAKISMG